MSRNRNKEIVGDNKNTAIENINQLLEELINSNDEKLLKRADLISFWIKTFCNFVKSEDTFNPKFLLKYSRGDVIKVNFGYRCKNELGGLHYAIVLDVDNLKSSGLITVIPLSSKKEHKKIHYSEVDLGNELFSSLISSHDKLVNELKSKLKIEKTKDENIEKINLILKDLNTLKKKKLEILKMKEGSIAMVGHISTISKVRIKDPVNKYDGILCGVKVSDTTLSAIDLKLAEMFSNIKIND